MRAVDNNVGLGHVVHARLNPVTSAALVALATAAIACGRTTESPVSPSPSSTSPSLVGLWTGAMIDDLAGTATTQITIASQADFTPRVSLLSGSWTQVGLDGTLLNDGRLSGTIDGPTVLFSITPRMPVACRNDAPNTVLKMLLALDGNHLTGEWGGLNCTNGTVDLRKR